MSEQIADKIEAVVRATKDAVCWKNVSERHLSISGAVSAQGSKWEAYAEIRRIGPALAHDLVEAGHDGIDVLRLVHAADGGGLDSIGADWPALKVRLQRLAIQLRQGGTASPAANGESTEKLVAQYVTSKVADGWLIADFTRDGIANAIGRSGSTVSKTRTWKEVAEAKRRQRLPAFPESIEENIE